MGGQVFSPLSDLTECQPESHRIFNLHFQCCQFALQNKVSLSTFNSSNIFSPLYLGQHRELSDISVFANTKYKIRSISFELHFLIISRIEPLFNFLLAIQFSYLFSSVIIMAIDR